MTYGLNPQLFVEDGPALHAARAMRTRNFVRFGRWRRLDEEHRLRAVERALQAPAIGLIDGYPPAL